MTGSRAASSISSERERGFAMIVVLWIVVALGLEIALLNSSIRSGFQLTSNEGAIIRGEALAQGAVEIAAARLSAKEQRDRWTADGLPRRFTLDGTTVSVRVSDENGKINVNKAEMPLLTGVFKSIAISTGEAEKLAARLLQWRDGAAADSAGFKRKTRPAQEANQRKGTEREFLDPNDAVRLLALSPEIAQRLVPFLTVHTREGKINPVTASDTVLRALPNVPPSVVEQLIQQRRRGLVTPEQTIELLAEAREYLTAERGPAVRLEIEIGADSQEAMGSATAVVLPALDAAAPFRMLAWRFQPTRRLAQTAAGQQSAQWGAGLPAQQGQP